MIIACDKWKAYSQTIKQLIAFDRRHIWWVKVTQAEKYYLIISGSTSSFFVELTGDFRKKIMLICTCLKLGGKDAGNNINCSLSHLNVNEIGFVCLGACARRHTLEPSQHNIFQKHGLISIYWSATKHNFNWNDNAWMTKNSKNSTPRGGQNFLWWLETPQLPLWRTYARRSTQTLVKWQRVEGRCTCRPRGRRMLWLMADEGRFTGQLWFPQTVAGEQGWARRWGSPLISKIH